MQQINFSTRFVPHALQTQAESLYPEALKHAKSLTDKTCLGADMTLWFDYVAQDAQKHIEEIQAIKRTLKAPFDLIVVVGTGGSSLGAKALARSLGPSFSHLNTPPSLAHPGLVFVGDLVAEECYASLIAGLERFFPLLVVISKSGGTLEPASGFRIMYDYLQGRFGADEANKRVITITDAQEGSLRGLTNNLKFQSQVVPQGIGGRYSVLTPVGLVPLSLAGIDVSSLISGAKEYRQSFVDTLNRGEVDIALEYACYRQAFQNNNLGIELLVSHDDRMGDFIEWWKQLFGESEGKEGKGIFPAGAIYSRDLHSLGQYVQEGKKQLFETFLSFTHCEARNQGYGQVTIKVPKVAALAKDKLDFVEGMRLSEINTQILKASQVAHFDAGVPSLGIEMESLDAFNLGALVFFFEVSCAVSALIQGVNPFDQPGVEAYKKNMLALLGRPEYHELGKALRQKIAGPVNTGKE